MKHILIASAIALSSLTSFAPIANAASTSVTTIERVDHRPGDRRMHQRRHHRNDCIVKKVKTRHHGRVVIKTTKVCR